MKSHDFSHIHWIVPRLKVVVVITLSLLSLMIIPAVAELDLRDSSKLSLKTPEIGGNHLTRMMATYFIR